MNKKLINNFKNANNVNKINNKTKLIKYKLF